MELLKEISRNYILMVAIASWFVAQIIKIVIDVVINKKFHPERLIGAGGMPSSHSALVTSMTCAVGNRMGIGSGAFAIALTLSVIVMYDAMGVRRAAGEQAKIINKLTEEHRRDKKEELEIDRALKEYLGHTPLEVLSGALLGIAVYMMIPGR